MGKERVSLGFDSELDSFDPADWGPREKNAIKERPKPEAAREAASAAGFHSREPTQAKPPNIQRRRRTGRDAQFNLKVHPNVKERFCDIADDQGWGLGETLEHAINALECQLSTEHQKKTK